MSNEHKLPRIEDVTDTPLGPAVRVTPENINHLVEAALMMYTNEPCRICGELIDEVQVRDAVFAGYSDDGKARSAHDDCWQRCPAIDNKPRPEWVHQ